MDWAPRMLLSRLSSSQMPLLVFSWLALVSPLPPQDLPHTAGNHAKDCDDSLGYEYPFVLKSVTSGGCWCAICPWDRMCRGCALPCTVNTRFSLADIK